MLLLSTHSFVVEGVTVFPDHADPNFFWYLPAPVALAQMPGSEEPQFLLIEYAPDVAATGVKGVGFLNVTTWLRVPDDVLQEITGQIRARFPTADHPQLGPVPFDEGSVQIVALDLQGGGGTANTAPPGAFEAVEHILGASSPELFGDNNALFALTLSEEGATILEAAFDNGMAPVGAIYNMKFTGVRPAIDVKITADLKRCYDSFSVGIEAKVYWVSAGIDATFEKLRQDGAIKIQVVNLAGDAESLQAEQTALNLFKDQILSQWFTPSLSPTTAAAADAGIPPLGGQTAATTPPATAHPVTTPPGGGTIPPVSHPPMGQVPGVHPPAVPGMGQMGTPVTAHPPGASVTPPAPAALAAHPTPAAGAPASGAAGPGASGPGGAAAAAGGAVGGALGGATGASVGAAAASAAAAAAGAGHPATAPGAPAQGAAAGLAALPGAAAQAASAASPFGVAFKLKIVHQDEQKTVEYEYNRMDAVQRVYAPQGYFGLMLAKADRAKHFLKVDGVDPFFHKFTVNVAPPRDFASIGLQTAHVGIDFGDPARPADTKHGDFVFDAQHATPQDWSVFQGEVASTEYRYTADYGFDPDAGWDGEHDRYELPEVTTENRQLVLDPRDFLGFLQVTLQPGHIDADLVDRIDVALHYGAQNGWTSSATLSFHPGSPAQSWKVRISDRRDNPVTGKSAFEYRYVITRILKTGQSLVTAETTTTARALIVDDPFLSALNVTVQPVFEAQKTKLAVVELHYDDAAGYRFQKTLQLAAGAPAQTVRIPQIDPAVGQFSYRTTLIDAANTRVQSAFVTTADTLVLVG